MEERLRLTFDVSFDCPADLVPTKVGESFMQTVGNKKVKFKITRAERDERIRQIAIVAVEIVDG